MTLRRRTAAMLSLLLGALVGAAPLGAQTGTGSVTGQITRNDTRTPLAGARVSVVGTSLTTVTRGDGRFTLPNVPAGSRRVRVTMIGYAAQERAVTVAAGTSTSADLSLAPSATTLSDVVVVGYGTQRREDLTGSVASVGSQELQKTTVTTLEQGLQGKVAGVQVTQGDAAPGGGMRVQIRGVNSMNSGSAQPLYVIDGIPVASSGTSKFAGSLTQQDLQSTTQTDPLAELAPEDIESIDILKDASATAIYGSRGANGVVLITTRKGHRNTAGQYTLNVSQGYSSVVHEIPVLNAYRFASYVNQAFINSYGPQTQYPYGGRPGSMTPDSIRTVLGPGTDWQSLIFRSAPVSDAQMGFSGGDEQGSYSISGNMLQQQGVIRGSAFRRGGLRVNLDRNVTERTHLSTDVAVTRSINDMVRTSTISGYRDIGVVRQAVTYQPMWFRDTTAGADPRAEDASTWATYGANPLRYTDEVQEADQLTRAIAGVRGVVTLGRGFSFDENLGANYERRDYDAYYPRTVNEGHSVNGDALQNGSEFGNLLTESLLRFNGGLGAHQHVEALGGFTYETDHSTWTSQEVQGFPNDILRGNVLQLGTNPLPPNSSPSTWALASWLGRVNYALYDRYLLTATVRADGSSKFAANNKWATFPALAFAWKTIDEPLLRNQTLLSDLKVRMSYGRSGNQAIGPYQSQAALSGVTMTQNEAIVPAYAVTQLANPNLRWETTSQYDAGIDLGTWHNRLTGTVDVYRKNTYDLLQQISLPTSTGFGNAWINSGNVTNRGIELQVGYDVLRDTRPGGLAWNVSANASHNVNRIESLGSGLTQQFAGRLGAGGNLEVAPFIQKPGSSIGAMYGYRTAGIVRNSADSTAYAALSRGTVHIGDVMYRDLNGDGKLTAADQTVIGDANPNWVWGMTNSVRFGRFDVSALLTAVRGGDIINVERMRYLTLNGSMNVPSYYVNNAFDPKTNPNGYLPMIRQDRQADVRFSDIDIENGSYLRLKNVQVGYNLVLPGAHTARLYVNGINLKTWTKYTGYDPEVSAFGGTDRPGVDLGSYPQARTVTVGVNTSF